MEVRGMDRKKLNWNKNNIDIAQAEVEKAITEADDRKIYGWIRAILWAVGAILEEMEKIESRNRKNSDSNACNIHIDVVDERQITWEDYGERNIERKL